MTPILSRIPGIYRITCIANSCQYIGSTKNLTRRAHDHFNTLRRQSHNNPRLQNAYNKYGEAAFVFEVLETCSIETLLEREQFYLNALKPAFNLVKNATGRTSNKSVKCWRQSWDRQCVICGEPILPFHSNGRKTRDNKTTCSATCRKALERAQMRLSRQ